MTTIATFENNPPKSEVVLDAPSTRHPHLGFDVSSIQDKAVAAPRWQVRSVIAVLGVMTLIHAIYVFSFYAPAHGGTDQNGYHVTARLLAEGKGASFIPKSPFSFVGNMMILTEDGRIYAKYPPGYPLLAAAARLVGGANAVYLVNPICTVLACALSFFFFRTLLSEFSSLIAVLWLSWNPVILNNANDGSSHAATLLLVIVGAWGLLSWMQNGSRWRGMVGAFCFGYAATIRYSEGLLVLPALFAAFAPLLAEQRLNLRNILPSLWLIFAWGIPIALLAGFCWSAFGAPWKTGYSYCAEETGFGWKYFIGDLALHRPGNWETLLIQMNWMGLFMLWPIALVGLCALIATRWREGLFIILWVIPPIALYLCYYWAPNGETTLSYLRFFVPVLPPLVLAALWLIDRAAATLPGRSIIPLSVLSALGLCINLWNVQPTLEPSLLARQALVQVTTFVQSHVPSGSALFIADDPLSNCLDAAGGYDLYNLQLFKNSSFTNFDRIMDDPVKAMEPDPRQRERIADYWHLLGANSDTGDFMPKSNEELRQSQDQLMVQLLRSKTPVFFLLRTGQNADYLPDRARWWASDKGSIVSVPRVLQSTFAVSAASIGPHFDATEMRTPNPVTWTLFDIRHRS